MAVSPRRRRKRKRGASARGGRARRRAARGEGHAARRAGRGGFGRGADGRGATRETRAADGATAKRAAHRLPQTHGVAADRERHGKSERRLASERGGVRNADDGLTSPTPPYRFSPPGRKGDVAPPPKFATRAEKRRGRSDQLETFGQLVGQIVRSTDRVEAARARLKPDPALEKRSKKAAGKVPFHRRPERRAKGRSKGTRRRCAHCSARSPEPLEVSRVEAPPHSIDPRTTASSSRGLSSPSPVRGARARLPFSKDGGSRGADRRRHDDSRIVRSAVLERRSARGARASARARVLPRRLARRAATRAPLVPPSGAAARARLRKPRHGAAARATGHSPSARSTTTALPRAPSPRRIAATPSWSAPPPTPPTARHESAGALAAVRRFLASLNGLWGQLIPMAFMFCGMALANGILDALKDTLVVTAFGGAEQIPYLTVYAVLPVFIRVRRGLRQVLRAMGPREALLHLPRLLHGVLRALHRRVVPQRRLPPTHRLRRGVGVGLGTSASPAASRCSPTGCTRSFTSPPSSGAT